MHTFAAWILLPICLALVSAAHAGDPTPSTLGYKYMFERAEMDGLVLAYCEKRSPRSAKRLGSAYRTYQKQLQRAELVLECEGFTTPYLEGASIQERQKRVQTNFAQIESAAMDPIAFCNRYRSRISSTTVAQLTKLAREVLAQSPADRDKPENSPEHYSR